MESSLGKSFSGILNSLEYFLVYSLTSFEYLLSTHTNGLLFTIDLECGIDPSELLSDDKKHNVMLIEFPFAVLCSHEFKYSVAELLGQLLSILGEAPKSEIT